MARGGVQPISRRRVLALNDIGDDYSNVGQTEITELLEIVWGSATQQSEPTNIRP